MFFIASLVNVPAGLQDMITNIVATATIGYSLLLHIRLYQIYPVLVIVPLVFLTALFHFVYHAFFATNEQLQQMEFKKLVQQQAQKKSTQNDNKLKEAVKSDDPESVATNQVFSQSQEIKLNDVDQVSVALQVTPASTDVVVANVTSSSTTINRRQSIQHGLQVLQQAQSYLQQKYHQSLHNPDNFQEDDESIVLSDEEDYELESSGSDNLEFSDLSSSNIGNNSSLSPSAMLKHNKSRKGNKKFTKATEDDVDEGLTLLPHLLPRAASLDEDRVAKFFLQNHKVRKFLT